MGIRLPCSVLFQTGVLRQDLPQSKSHKDMSIKTFAKYLLRHGTLTGQREVLSRIKMQDVAQGQGACD